MPKKQIKRTTELVTGIVGLGVASGVSATLPGMTGVITRTGTLPVAGLGLMGLAGEPYSTTKKRRKK